VSPFSSSISPLNNHRKTLVVKNTHVQQQRYKIITTNQPNNIKDHYGKEESGKTINSLPIVF